MSRPHDASSKPVALITGGSAGLGLVTAQTFAARGFHVAIAGRDLQRIQQACESIASSDDSVLPCVGDVTDRDDCSRMRTEIEQRWRRLDVLVNCVGASDRGLTMELEPDRVRELMETNVIGTLVCTQTMMPLLIQSGGSVVNIGSLAGKVGARFLGGYNAAKHALTGLTQQMRLELREHGVHVGLISPGPIRRDDAGSRYADRAGGALPESAAAPGGGTNFKGLDPQLVADAVFRCATKRVPDFVLPRYMRILIAVGNASPRLGDWLLLKFTKSGKKS
ncbi:SDR family NAD(P)-dependent oxidoreductase [Roseiconus lacunae]|uniref:SDR family NAD(P)-dependent oxidoreductase n=1 Tax=Roseiconus lacunae TaxID=2605694 RepID=UPI001356DCA1|nr:SDR family NAD(P)-dependent oxidoreductase [Roseiconus lacunae]WRQ52199.1 SDR family NAD(P)-dependent oxidoreductase [Stieleria sp. HD01]